MKVCSYPSAHFTLITLASATGVGVGAGVLTGAFTVVRVLAPVQVVGDFGVGAGLSDFSDLLLHPIITNNTIAATILFIFVAPVKPEPSLAGPVMRI